MSPGTLPVPVRLALLSALCALLALPLPAPADAAPAAPAAGALVQRATSAPDKPAVLTRTVIGRSVQGRPLVAYHLGEPGRPGVPKVVLISVMHGNEGAPRQILKALVGGPEVIGVDLWVLPTYNPDGLAAGTRKNAHGVDLNRNFPYGWVDLDGSYESGPKAASEPETRAVMAWLRTVKPQRILSFHQPLNGVDTDTKVPSFAKRVARKLRLPTQNLDCGGVCHGTMTGWFNHHFAGAAITVEYGASPTRRRMRHVAPDQVLSVFRATRGVVGYEPLLPTG